MIRRSAPASSPHPCLVAAILFASTTPLSGQVPGHDVVEIPAVFEADRIYVRPVTAAGDTLVFYTDTGGGANMLYAPTAERLDLPRERMPADGDSVTTVPWPDWHPGASIPRPAGSTGPMGERLLVVPFEGHAAMMQDSTDAGFLGRLWFADRTWTFDYPAEELLLRPPGDLPAHEGAQRIDLGFQTDSAGRRTTHFPRIQVVIDGDTLDVLFDTGATMALTAEALEAIGDGGPTRRAASFISAAVFDAWRSEHPDWRVIERAYGRGPHRGSGGRDRGPAERARVVRTPARGNVRGPHVALDGSPDRRCARRQRASGVPRYGRLPGCRRGLRTMNVPI